jgi:hypothetical protein
MCEIAGMRMRHVTLLALVAAATACSTQDKKPRLPERAVVGMWRSDTLRARDSSARLYSLRVAPDGMAEFTSESVGHETKVERGTWDGADSLLRVVVRAEGSIVRPTSILLAIRGNRLGLVEFDTTAWGSQGLTLHRR